MPNLLIQSHVGSYQVHFGNLFYGLESGLHDHEHLIIDAKVAELYEAQLAAALNAR